MNIEEIRNYCLAKEEVTESFPFDETSLFFKVKGKIFLGTDLVDDLAVCIKCDPELAIELRERYNAVTPGYHMNKKHWNTVLVDGSIPDKEIYDWIDLSYNLVCKKG